MDAAARVGCEGAAAGEERLRMLARPGARARAGEVIDHVNPLKRGGPDAPWNMQWQTTESAKQKDKWE